MFVRICNSHAATMSICLAKIGWEILILNAVELRIRQNVGFHSIRFNGTKVLRILLWESPVQTWYVFSILFVERFHFSSSCTNPIFLRGRWGGSLAWSSAKAVLMASNWAQVDSLMSFWSWRMSSMSSFKSLKSLRSWAISAWLSGTGKEDARCRNATNARMMSRLTLIAVSEFNTLLSMATPSSVTHTGDIDFLLVCLRSQFVTLD